MKIICGSREIASDLVILGGAPSATRTRDLLLRRQLLYPLSYRGQPGPQRPVATAQARSSVAGRLADRAVLTLRHGIDLTRTARLQPGRQPGIHRPPSTASTRDGTYGTHPARLHGAGSRARPGDHAARRP
jgi:hypothetical protein